jgi:hypothetical protein
MTPICLTDEQMSAVLRAAEPLPHEPREPFLLVVADRLRGVPIRDGSVGRIVREVQREFWSPPELLGRHAPRWSAKVREA